MMKNEQKAFQELIQENHCFGCGSLNEYGLQIRSYWDGEESVCNWKPREYHMAGPTHVLNGGIIATLIDCHSICTAIAAAYRNEGREIGSGERIWYATGYLKVSYKRPAPIVEEVTLRARITDITDRKTLVACSIYAEDKECSQAELLAIRVPPEWLLPPP
jgi:acyl-coenzyme A thioesterase PaaI-like protein